MSAQASFTLPRPTRRPRHFSQRLALGCAAWLETKLATRPAIKALKDKGDAALEAR
jgi:hypothetical protein